MSTSLKRAERARRLARRRAGGSENVIDELRHYHLDVDVFDAAFFPGGYGLLWDLASDSHAIRLIERFVTHGKPVAMVCHAPGILRDAKDFVRALLEQYRPMVEALRDALLDRNELVADEIEEVILASGPQAPISTFLPKA